MASRELVKAHQARMTFRQLRCSLASRGIKDSQAPKSSKKNSAVLPEVLGKFNPTLCESLCAECSPVMLPAPGKCHSTDGEAGAAPKEEKQDADKCKHVLRGTQQSRLQAGSPPCTRRMSNQAHRFL